MRIIINASAVSAVKGGASFYIVNIVKALAEIDKRNEFTILCTPQGKAHFTGIPGITRCFATAPKSVPVRLFWEQVILPFICLRFNADILFSPNYSMPLVSFGHKNIVAIFDLSFFPLSKLYPLSRRLFKWIIPLSCWRADAIITISECTQRDIEKYVGKPVNKTTVVYCAADNRFTDNTPFSQSVLDNFNIEKPYILFTGFLEPRKNLVRLITAFSKICSRIPHDLVIAGGNGWWYEKLPDTIKSAGIIDRVRFLGYVPDESLPSLYHGASLFAFVSLYEGFGIAALESLWCETPVLASNNTSLPEVVGEAGIYVDPYNVEDIADKLCSVNNTELMSMLKSKCIPTARRFSWQKAARETLSAFENALNSKNANT